MDKIKTIKNTTIIRVIPTNIGIGNDDKLPNLNWISDKSFLKECLEELSKNDTIREEILNSEKIVIGNEFPYVIKINSLENLDFEFISDKSFLRKKFRTPRSVMDSADYKFKFNNKYNILKLFKEKYPDHYNNLDNRYDSIERGGNMVDFNHGKVILSIFDYKTRSGYETTLCKITDLYL